jgi:tRNA(fMet)-specific endonuclease VapC
MKSQAVFVLDTDHLGILQHATGPDWRGLLGRMSDYQPENFYVTVVSFHEQVSGWNTYLHRAKAPEGVVRAYRMFQGILADFAAMQVLPYDDAAAGMFQSLRRQRIRIGTMDLRIASITLTKGYRLLSGNLRDYGQVPGLVVEDWARSQ